MSANGFWSFLLDCLWCIFGAMSSADVLCLDHDHASSVQHLEACLAVSYLAERQATRRKTVVCVRR